ncbi:hypothetical protein AB9K26_07105 [Psychroserpens sp. XS_ASV72]|uniref:hypothetical protein n=1 Tax=Psychroserpens sp. XS_ASV72 TaxID=3241293 RepID=UPI003518BD8A
MNSHKTQELAQRIDEVLYYLWDPIGVSDIPGARGEYSSYVKTILKYTIEEDVHKISSQLGKIETTAMGLLLNKTKNIEVAERLVEYKNAIEQGLK